MKMKNNIVKRMIVMTIIALLMIMMIDFRKKIILSKGNYKNCKELKGEGIVNNLFNNIM